MGASNTTLYIIVVCCKNNLLQAILLFGMAVAVTTIPYAIWQFVYYGDLVPNTFYAKAAGFSAARFASGWAYLSKYIWGPPFLPLLTLGAALWALKKGQWNSKIVYLFFVVAAYLLFVACVGGDHMQAFRFIVPVIPVMAFLLAMCFLPQAISIRGDERYM
jgi:arabinofuranosyltransferase